MFKKLIITILVIVLGYFIQEVVRISFFDNTSMLIQYRVPTRMVIFDEGKEVVVDNKELVESFHKVIRNKFARRVSASETEKVWNNRIIDIEYGISGKGKSFIIDSEGRIKVSLDKGDIRNRSPLHWLWWKYDNTINNRTYIEYVTNPNDDVFKVAKEIMNRYESNDSTVFAEATIKKYFEAYNDKSRERIEVTQTERNRHPHMVYDFENLEYIKLINIDERKATISKEQYMSGMGQIMKPLDVRIFWVESEQKVYNAMRHPSPNFANGKHGRNIILVRLEPDGQWMIDDQGY